MAIPCFTQHQVNQLWNYAKEEYVNKPDYKGFEWLIKKLSDDTKAGGGRGLEPNEVARLITSPKSVRKASLQMYRQQANRTRTLADAKAYTEGFDKSVTRKALTSLLYAPQSLKVAGHTTALMGTHGWRYAFRPTQWLSYGRAIVRSFESMSPARAERIRQDIVTHPMYDFAAKPADYVNIFGQTKKTGGLAVDPMVRYDDVQKYAHKLLGPLGRMTDNAFLGLKWLRMNQFERRWNALPDDLKTEKMRGLIQMAVNHSTGATPELRIPEGMRIGMFAPGLEASRWQSLVFDPLRTIGAAMPNIEVGGRTILKGAGPEARYIALRRVGTAAEIAATYYILGKTAEALSGNSVNLTDPSKSDFLLYRFGKRIVNYTGGMAGTVRTSARLSSESPKKYGQDTPDIIGQYVRGKLSPIAAAAIDAYTGKDFMGNPMPWRSQDVGKRGRPTGKPPLSWPEYLNQTFGPLGSEEAVKEAMQTFKQHGVPYSDAKGMSNVFVPLIVSMFGGHTYVEEEKARKR